MFPTEGGAGGVVEVDMLVGALGLEGGGAPNIGGGGAPYPTYTQVKIQKKKLHRDKINKKKSFSDHSQAKHINHKHTKNIVSMHLHPP